MTQVPLEIEEAMLAIRLGSVVCCVDLSTVIRVTSLVELQQIPKSPSYLKGIMTYRGENLMVVDLPERLSLSDLEPYTLDTPILICRSQQGLGAFIIDEILGITQVKNEDKCHQATFNFREKVPFKGVVTTEHGPALWLDVDSAVKVVISAEFTNNRAEVEGLLQDPDNDARTI